MSKNLIFICKNKLIGIDGILPILMEAKALFPNIRIAIVFLNNNHLNAVKKNYNIWEIIQSMDSSVYAMRGRNKFISVIRLAKFILRFSFKNNVIIKNADTLPLHTILMKILKKISNTKEIKAYLVIKSLESYKHTYIHQVLSRERQGRSINPKFFKGNYDYFISPLTSNQFKELFDTEAPKHKMVKVGYIRRLPQWQKYMNETIKKTRIVNNGTYFLYILTCLGHRCHQFNEPEIIELLEESLNVLKRYNSKIKTIFKPHMTTDVKRVEKLLSRINYSNYIIDYSHPMVLSARAKFVFGNFFSTTLFDAYYQGKPVIEYCQYDPELLSRLNNQSIGGRCCDFFIRRDQKKLDEVLNKIINEDVRVTRDPNFIQENFSDTPKEFYDFWHKLLA